MRIVQIADLNVGILDDNERSKLIALLGVNADSYKERFRSIKFGTKSGESVDGATFFDMANGFENRMLEISLEDNLRVVDGYIRNVDLLIEAVPGSFQLHFLKG